jgi:hypothetical protein
MRDTRRRITLKTILILAACLTLAAPVLRQAQDVALAQVSAAFDLSWHVIGSGGGQMGGPGHTIAGTIGQPTVGTMGGSGHALCSGFWCGIPAEYRVYLPLILRNSP